MSDNLPALSGIARKQRSDKGVPRKSTMDSFYDQFRSLSDSQQDTVLEVLTQLRRFQREPRPTAPLEEEAQQ